MRFGKQASVGSKINIFHSKLSRTGNRASVDWTVGKLLNIILAMVVLALVAYGISTQSLNPLWDNLSGKFNEVKILSPWNNDVASGDCHEERVSISSEGRDFLKAIGMEGKEVILNVCKNRICNISGAGVTPYRVNQGKFEKLEGGKWKEYNSLIVEGISSVEFNWELYNAGVDILLEVKDLYDYGFTRRFILSGEGGWLGKDIYAVWQNDEWRVRVGNDIPNGEGWVKEGDNWVLKGWWGSKTRKIENYHSENDNKAIDTFAKKVRGINDYKVYWKETIPTMPDKEYIGGSDYGESIGTLVGNIGWLSSFNELDDNREVANLKSEFIELRKKYLSEARVSVEELSIINIKDVEIDDKTFEVGIEEDGNFPIITLSSDGEKFGLRHSAYAKINSNFVKGVKLRYFPVVLAEWNGKECKEIGNEEYYRLPKENFDEVYRATLISRFLKDKCR